MGLTGRKIVLLDAARGVGLAVALGARKEGAQVVVTTGVPAQLQELRARHGLEGTILDMADVDALSAFFQDTGSMDHVVMADGCDAGSVPFLMQTVATGRARFDSIFWTAAAVAWHACPLIRPGGSIILTSGWAAHRGLVGSSIAGAACAAVEALTRALAVELAPVRVNAVCPGPMQGCIDEAFSERLRADLFAGAGRQLPLGRLGRADDVAEAYLYLMKNAFSTGSVVVCDGGGLQGDRKSVV